MRCKSILMSLALVLVFSGGAWAESIVIKGSTTVLPIMQKMVEEFMERNPEYRVSLSGGGSSFGITAMLDRTCDIAMASRLVSAGEERKAQEKGMYLVKHEIALDAVIPVVHPNNPIDNLSVDQLRAIYMGKIQNWSMIGGKDKRIAVISRDSSSGTYETWEEYVLAGNRVYRGALLQASNGAIVQTVNKSENAIGYIGIGYMDKSVKALSVNGIEPTRENAQDWVFPIVRTLQVYTNGAPQGGTAKMIEFIKSPEGQDIVEEVGFIRIY